MGCRLTSCRVITARWICAPGARLSATESKAAERNPLGRRGGEEPAVQGGPTGGGVDLDVAEPAMAEHRRGGNVAGGAYRDGAPDGGERCARGGLGCEHHRDLGGSRAAAAELRSEHQRLRGVDHGVRVPGGSQAGTPALSTRYGFAAKNAGSQSTTSASLPTSSEPTSCASPCAIAGLMVSLAR
jgi:hypothetical protein